MLKAISRSVVSFVFPLGCELCGAILPPRIEGGVCKFCQGRIPLTEPPFSEDKSLHFDRVFAGCYYEDKVKNLLCAFKFRHNGALLWDLLHLLERKLEGQDASQWDALTAVPMPRRKELERGFNQAQLLAQGTAKHLGKPFLKDALKSTGEPLQQAKLSKTARRENVKHLFRASKTAAGKNILLVDDILTTGETASQCALALKKAGAKRVDVLVVARGH